MLKVVHYQRFRSESHFSIERYFEGLRQQLGDTLSVKVVHQPFVSKGILRRSLNILFSAFRQGDVNHITGDINYIIFGLIGSRTLLTVHDCEVLRRTVGIKRTILRKLWFEWPLRRAIAVTAVSNETKRTLIEEFGSVCANVRVINTLVPALTPAPKEFSCTKPRILQIGTKKNKNVIRVVEALNGISCTLEIVGPVDKDLRKALEDNQIQYSSSMKLSDGELQNKYCECDLVAFVSTYEGFGMPIVEAQWIERPVVTSNCSSMPEVAGDGACFVDPFDVQSIREGILKVINDSQFRESIIAKGRENRERFRPEIIAKQFEELYREVAGRCASS